MDIRLRKSGEKMSEIHLGLCEVCCFSDIRLIAYCKEKRSYSLNVLSLHYIML